MKVTLTAEEVTGFVYDRICAEFNIKADTLKPIVEETTYEVLEFVGYEFEVER